jgi:ribosomal protein S27E
MLIASVAQAGLSCFILGFGLRQLSYARSALHLRVCCPNCGQLGVPQLEDDLSQMVCYNCNTLYQIVIKRRQAFNQCLVCGEIDTAGEKRENYICDTDDLDHILFTKNAEKAKEYLQQLQGFVKYSIIITIIATGIFFIPIFINSALFFLLIIPASVYFFCFSGALSIYLNHKKELQEIIQSS